MRIVAAQCNARGYRLGESHHKATHSDKVVEQARALHFAQGMPSRQIAKEIGVHRSTVMGWLTGRQRVQKWVKVKMVRVYE
ncbi:helix-turn-helix domain-containing protein [Limnohabitans sp. Bal53]|uniref:helix-turn-helix domain-containing protein n=1 Tax=Limnohabitans sp. Bal53 TaxID=1977910 RepID=UPI000D3AD274|nr:helix-turn-helix domain-containing protein [Limnohabitans sp. Bal53]PUE41430.1 hypothetical protein B9Z50_06900 [Limnohabitans sp. Bal53]